MKIGSEEISIQPESKKAMDVEIMLLVAVVYVVIFVYANGYLSWPVFYLLFHICYMRFFMGNHDRFHADRSSHWPRPVELFSEYFAVVVTPWDEPYDSIRHKHFIHHSTHLPNRTPEQDVLKDPHSIYEAGGPWRSLFYSLFFEEAQLVIDIRNRNITPSRWIRLAIYLPLQVLFLMTFGWEKYLGVFLAVRLMSASGWFIFSWFTHTHTYEFGVIRKVPAAKVFLFFWGLINGRRVRDGFFVHTSHHAWPHIPSCKLHLLDEAVMRHPEAKPELAVTR